MHINIAFLVKDETKFVDLRSISEVVDIPVGMLKGMMFDLGVDKEICVYRNGSTYINESTACDLLNRIEVECGKDKCAETFHIWLHSAFDRFQPEEADSPEDDGASEPNADDSEAESADEAIDLIVQLLQMIVPAVGNLSKRVKALEEQ